MTDPAAPRIADLEARIALLEGERDEARANEERFRVLIEKASDMVLVLDASGAVVYTSPSTEALLGYLPEDLVGRSCFDFVHPDDHEPVLEAFARTLGIEDRGDPIEMRIRNREGQWRAFEGIGTNVLDNPAVEGIVVNFRDITARNTAQEELAREKERLAVTLGSIGDGVIATDNDGRIALMNRVAGGLTGWTQDEALGRNLSRVIELVDERTGEDLDCPAQGVAESGRAVELSQHTLLRDRDGERRLIDLQISPIRDRRSEIIGVVLVIRDITRDRELEQIVQRSEKLDALGVLAGGIAHDFNNLLTAVIGNIGMARFHAPQGEKLDRMLGEAEKASDQARNLTQQLLTFARGGAPVRKAATISDLLEDTSAFVLSGASSRGEYHLAEDLWPADVDQGQMVQVIQNLLINADQAMPAGGVVTVRADNVLLDQRNDLPLPLGRYVRIQVTDQGVGIPPDILGSIFDPFFTTKQRGSGLGLAVCHSIVRNHEGHLSVDSRPGEGATFTIHLPAAGTPPAAEQGEEAIDTIAGDARVLVMDDEELVRTTADMMLRHLGYDVVCTVDADGAVDEYRRAMESGCPFDVVLLDLTVPGGKGGLEAAAELRKIDPQVVTVVSSGYSTDPVMSDPGRHGFAAVVAKPYKLESLSAALRRAVSGG
jgi:PAS domain S-box-containing protein